MLVLFTWFKIDYININCERENGFGDYYTDVVSKSH